MEIKKKLEVNVVVGFQCDVCGKECAEQEHAILQAKWGCDSKKDLEKHEAHLCEPCYDKIVEFIRKLGGNVRVEEYFFI